MFVTWTIFVANLPVSLGRDWDYFLFYIAGVRDIKGDHVCRICPCSCEENADKYSTNYV